MIVEILRKPQGLPAELQIVDEDIVDYRCVKGLNHQRARTSLSTGQQVKHKILSDYRSAMVLICPRARIGLCMDQ